MNGTYRFSFAATDDAGWLWIGPTAVSGYDHTNALVKGSSSYNAGGFQPGSATAQATYIVNSCTFIPFRLIYVNAQSSGALGFGITGPDGKVVVSDTVAVTDNQLVSGCTGGGVTPIS